MGASPRTPSPGTGTACAALTTSPAVPTASLVALTRPAALWLPAPLMVMAILVCPLAGSLVIGFAPCTTIRYPLSSVSLIIPPFMIDEYVSTVA